MDFDGTLSTELAMLRKQKDEYNDVLTMPPPLDNDGSADGDASSARVTQ